MSQTLISQIQLLACNRATVGWEEPSGQTLPIASNELLFYTIGTEYGGNDTTTFNLPTLAPSNKVNYYCNIAIPGSNNEDFASVIGEVILWPGTRMPEGWYECNGQFLPQANSSLYPVIGDVFGSKGSEFAVPTIPSPKSNPNLRYIICGFGYEAKDLAGYVSSIKWFAGDTDTLPTSWEKCKGQEVAIRSNTTLYSLLGTTYGGNEETFYYPTLPDLTPGVSSMLCLTGFYPPRI